MISEEGVFFTRSTSTNKVYFLFVPKRHFPVHYYEHRIEIVGDGKRLKCETLAESSIPKSLIEQILTDYETTIFRPVDTGTSDG